MFIIQLSRIEGARAKPSTKAKKKGLTKAKARQILHDKEIRGHPLTEQQRKFFGAVGYGKKKGKKR